MHEKRPLEVEDTLRGENEQGVLKPAVTFVLALFISLCREQWQRLRSGRLWATGPAAGLDSPLQQQGTECTFKVNMIIEASGTLIFMMCHRGKGRAVNQSLYSPLPSLPSCLLQHRSKGDVIQMLWLRALSAMGGWGRGGEGCCALCSSGEPGWMVLMVGFFRFLDRSKTTEKPLNLQNFCQGFRII